MKSSNIVGYNLFVAKLVISIDKSEFERQQLKVRSKLKPLKNVQMD